MRGSLKQRDGKDLNEVFDKLYSSPGIFEVMKSGIHTICDTYVLFMWCAKNECTILDRNI